MKTAPSRLLLAMATFLKFETNLAAFSLPHNYLPIADPNGEPSERPDTEKQSAYECNLERRDETPVSCAVHETN